ncbi:MAG: ABC transporter substrate-binding protein [Spirochaetales bacterium]|nr:ABC transporter substrate-binding protein [Spirochaetales bacterium]
MKKAILMLAMISLSVLLFANGGSETATTGEKPLKIGVSQFVQHPALDAVYKGITDEMAALGYEDVVYDYQNSNADVNTARQIANLFQSKKMDLVVGIATPNAQALKMGVTNAPVIYSAITDPLSAGLVESLEIGDPGINGVSFKNPFKEQIEFLLTLRDVKVLGQVYTGNEDNAMFQAAQVEKACNELGIEYIGTSVTSSAEVKSAAETLISRVDALFVSTDNTVVSALNGLATTALAHKVPIISSDTASAKENPVLVAWGFDWYYIGQETARMMDQILKGAKTEELATTVVSDPTYMEMVINTAVAEKIGIDFPKEVLDQADLIIAE